GPGDRADFFSHVSFQLVDQGVVAVHAGLQRDERADRLALDLVFLTDDRGFSHLLMVDQGALDFHRADAVTGYIHHIVHAAEQPIVTVLIALAAVAGEIFSREPAPIGLHVTFWIAVD